MAERQVIKPDWYWHPQGVKNHYVLASGRAACGSFRDRTGQVWQPVNERADFCFMCQRNTGADEKTDHMDAIT